MAKLKYSDEELIKLYRGAKDKNKQIEILADMRCCKPEEIISMLSCAGEIPGMGSKVKGKSEEGIGDNPSSVTCGDTFSTREKAMRTSGTVKKRVVRRWTSEEIEQLQEYIEEGLSYSDIADRFGRNLQAIYDAVSKYKLKGKNWQIQNVLPGGSAEVKGGDSSTSLCGSAQNDVAEEILRQRDVEAPSPTARGANERECKNGAETNKKSEVVVLEKCVDAAEKRVIQLSNAIADAGCQAKILHDIIRVAGSGIEDMCEDPIGAYQTMLGCMEEIIKDIRKMLMETGEEYND